MAKIFYLVLLVIFFSGCSFFGDTQKELLDHKIVVLDDKFYDDFKLLNVASRKNTDGFTEIEAMFANTKTKNIKVAYRIDWFDKDNFLVDTIMSRWKVINVDSLRNFVIRGVSPSIKAVNYQVRIMYPTKDDELRNNPLNYEYQGK